MFSIYYYSRISQKNFITITGVGRDGNDPKTVACAKDGPGSVFDLAGEVELLEPVADLIGNHNYSSAK